MSLLFTLRFKQSHKFRCMPGVSSSKRARMTPKPPNICFEMVWPLRVSGPRMRKIIYLADWPNNSSRKRTKMNRMKQNVTQEPASSSM